MVKKIERERRVLATPIHTYCNGREAREEIGKLAQEGYNFFPIRDFANAKEMFSSPELIMSDISSLIVWLRANEGQILQMEDALYSVNNTDYILLNKKYFEMALEMFPSCFSETPCPVCSPEVLPNPYWTVNRRPLYVYSTHAEAESISDYCANSDEDLLVSMTHIQQAIDSLARTSIDSCKRIIVDVTSAAVSLGANLLVLETLCAQSNNLYCIVQEKQADAVFEDYPMMFSVKKGYLELFPGITQATKSEPDYERRGICQLCELELDDFLNHFNQALIGHTHFKSVFDERVRAFSMAHQLGDKKLFSLFLFGNTGIGKTETARVIHGYLGQGHGKLARINFENYSSKDALNSLIGSPAGYIGCEGGELNEKIDNSDTQVILCDEFEKTTPEVQSFFLELLEEGQYTDRMGKEHDLDGYLVVFTSNITSESDFNAMISPELRSRFDLVCEFEDPSIAEKKRYVESLITNKLNAYRVKLHESESAVSNLVVDINAIGEFTDGDLSRLSLRQIKNITIERLMRAIEEQLENGQRNR